MSHHVLRFMSSWLASWVALSLSSCSSSQHAAPASGREAVPGVSMPRDPGGNMPPDTGASVLLDAGHAARQDTKSSPQPEAETSWPSGGPCDSAPVTQRLWDNRYPKEMQPISRDSGLWLDVARAAVIDVSDATAPRVRGKVDLGDASLAPDAGAGSAGWAEVTMTSLAERRAIAAVRHEPSYGEMSKADSDRRLPDDLLVLGFDDPDAPAVLQRLELPGDVALVSVLAPADGRAARVYVISDELELRCIGPSKQSYLYSFAFGADTLVHTNKIALGDDLALAERRGDYLVLIDGTYVSLTRGEAHEPSLRTVSLKQEAPVISGRAQAPFVGYTPPSIKMSVEADVLTLVSEDAKVQPGLHLRRYELSDTNSPNLISDCVSTAASNVRFDSSAKAAVLGDRVIVEGSWAAIGNGPITNGLIELNTACETRRQEQSVNLIAVPGARVAIEVTASDPHTIRVQLLDANHNEAVSTAAVRIPEAREIALRDNIALADVVMFDQNGTLERGLLGVATGWGQSNERALQLFSFSANTITPRGTLLDATSLSIPTSSGVAATKYDSAWGETFGTFELDGDVNAARSSVGELRLSPLD